MMANRVSMSEPIRQSQLELPVGKDVRASRVLSEVHGLNDINVAIRNKVRVVKQVKCIGSELELIFLQVKGTRDCVIEECNEFTPFGISPSRPAHLTAS